MPPGSLHCCPPLAGTSSPPFDSLNLSAEFKPGLRVGFPSPADTLQAVKVEGGCSAVTVGDGTRRPFSTDRGMGGWDSLQWLLC